MNYRHHDNPNVTTSNPLKEFFILLASIVVIILVVFYSLGAAVELIALHASTDFEKGFGDTFIKAFIEEKDKESRNATENYFQEIADKIIPELELPNLNYKIHVVEGGDTLNALALPGGHILIFSELIRGAQSENEVVMVLGHELGHYKNRDQLRGMGRGLAFAALLYFISPEDSFLGSSILNMAIITQLSFSREQEEEADKIGLAALNNYYGHVAGATEFFKRIQKLPEEKNTPEFLSTHPLSEKRIEKIDKIIKQKSLTIGTLKKLPENLIPSKN